jgi:TM2 domain-containing membrane protein YozV
MKKNCKAALLSAFVLPGVGQLYKGRKLKGGVLLLLVNILLFSLLGLIVQGLSRIDFTAAVPDTGAGIRIIRQLLTGTPAFIWVSGALFCLWLYGVIDALLGNGNDISS